MRSSRVIFQSTVGVVNVWGGKIKVAGEIIAFAGAAIPSGFLLANGALVSRTSYANLFAAIGVIFGAGDGSTTFALPDLRGEFIRGTDNGRGVDAARANGSAQAGQNAAHDHGEYADVNTSFSLIGGQAGAGNFKVPRLGATTNQASTSSGGTEPHPRNIAMQYLIQF